MTHAYDENFLDDAMDTLGTAVEYAVLSCRIPGQEFLDLFQISGAAERFGRGDVALLSGMSGIELANHILARCGKKVPAPSDELPQGYPAEYWIGWILAYYQWHSGRSFTSILQKLPYESMRNLYGVLHEADPSKAVLAFDELLTQPSETNLARLRKARRLSQSQLAAEADISLRSIQLYEQRKNEINNAQYNRLSDLAKALGCAIEDLLE